MCSTGNGGLKKRTLNSHLHRFTGFIITLAATNTDMCYTLVLHNGLHIRKVQVDDRRTIDQVRNTLNRLLQHFISLLKSFRHSRTTVNNFKELIIWNHNQGIYILFDSFNTIEGILHSCSGFKSERFGNNTYSKNAHILCNLSNDRSSTRTGSATHSACNKHHICTFYSSSNLFRALLCGFFPDFRFSTCTQSFCKLLTDLKQIRSLTKLKSLFISINTNEFNAGNILINHSIYSIIACSTNTNNDNLSRRLGITCLNFKHCDFLLLSHINIHFLII